MKFHDDNQNNTQYVRIHGINMLLILPSEATLIRIENIEEIKR